MRNKLSRFFMISALCLAGLAIIPIEVFCQNSFNKDKSPIPFRKGNKWGYVNSKKEILIPLQYDDAGVFCDKRAWVKIRGKYRYIGLYGETISFKEYRYAGLGWYLKYPMRGFKFKKFTKATNFFNGYADAYRGKKYCYLDTLGTSERIRSICGTGWIPGPPYWESFKYNNKVGLIHQEQRRDGNGHQIIVTIDSVAPLYDSVKNTRTSYCAVKKGDYWGLLGPQGQEITSFKFTSINYFQEGAYALVIENNLFGIIDENGSYKVPPKYDSIQGFITGAYNSHIHLAKVKMNSKYGFINQSGKEICPLKYDDVLDFEGGFSRVRVDGKYGYIDENGKEYFEE